MPYLKSKRNNFYFGDKSCDDNLDQIIGYLNRLVLFLSVFFVLVFVFAFKKPAGLVLVLNVNCIEYRTEL